MGFLGFVIAVLIVGFMMKLYQKSLIAKGKQLTWLKIIKYILVSSPFMALCSAYLSGDEDVVPGFIILSSPYIVWNLFILGSFLEKPKHDNAVKKAINKAVKAKKPFSFLYRNSNGRTERLDIIITSEQEDTFKGYEIDDDYNKVIHLFTRSSVIETYNKPEEKLKYDLDQSTGKADDGDVVFMYEDNKGDHNQESVYPYEVTGDYVMGYCNNTGKDRKFYHDRIQFYFGNGDAIIKRMKDKYYADKREAKQSIVTDLSAPSSDPNTINFKYQDNSGDTTKRSVILRDVDDEYFTGICLDRKQSRTFRKDRVLEYCGDSKQRLQRFVSSPKKSTKKKVERTSKLSINFVGFPHEEQVLLEALAKPYKLKVLKTQTKSLFAIVSNEELPEKQIEKATENGTLIMNKQQFLHFLETGEINGN